jgi:hypothetical protein
VPRPISDCAAAGGVAGTTVEPTDGADDEIGVSDPLETVLSGVSEVGVDRTALDKEVLTGAEVDNAEELVLVAAEELSVVWSADGLVGLDWPDSDAGVGSEANVVGAASAEGVFAAAGPVETLRIRTAVRMVSTASSAAATRPAAHPRRRPRTRSRLRSRSGRDRG